MAGLSIGAHVSSMSRVNSPFLRSKLSPLDSSLADDEISSEDNALFHEHWLLLRFDLLNSVDLAKSFEAFVTGKRRIKTVSRTSL